MQFLLDKLHFLGVMSTANIAKFCSSVCGNVDDKECAYGECLMPREEGACIL